MKIFVIIILVTLSKSYNCKTNPLKYVRPSLFPTIIPPYINFPNLNKPQIIPQQIKKSLLWPTTYDIVKPLFDQVAKSTDLTLLSERDSCFTHHGEQTIIGTHKRIKKCKMLVGKLEKHMKVRGIFGIIDICYKDKLGSLLAEMKTKFPTHSFNYIILTFNIPEEFDEFKKAWEKTDNKLWISKRPTGSMSRGVFVISHWKDIPLNKTQTVAKYLDKPWLFNNRKIEFRVLFLVTSFKPLRVYALPKLDRFIFQMSNFTLDESTIADRCVHIRDKAQCGYSGPEEHSVKMRNTIFEAVENEGGNRERIMHRIYSAVKQILLFWESKLPSNRKNDPKYFQYLATDWFIDQNFNPLLNEINGSPRLNGHFLKFYNTLPEMFNLAGYHFPPTLSRDARIILRRDLQLKMDKDHKSTTNHRSKIPVTYYNYFNNTRTALDEFKQDFFKGISSNRDILENLTKYETILLAITEDELNRLRYAKRILPSSNMVQYFPIINSDNIYYYRLLAAWEEKYQNQRNKGRELLNNLIAKFWSA